MLERDDITKLSGLARIFVPEEEKDALVSSLSPVLAYVSEVGEVVTGEELTPEVGDLRNVMREDTDPYEGGQFSKAIMRNAPRSEDGYVKVPPIL